MKDPCNLPSEGPVQRMSLERFLRRSPHGYVEISRTSPPSFQPDARMNFSPLSPELRSPPRSRLAKCAAKDSAGFGWFRGPSTSRAAVRPVTMRAPDVQAGRSTSAHDSRKYPAPARSVVLLLNVAKSPCTSTTWTPVTFAGRWKLRFVQPRRVAAFEHAFDYCLYWSRQ